MSNWMTSGGWDSPPPSWYEPPDELEDDDSAPAPVAAEALVVLHGEVWWTATDDLDAELFA